MSSDPNINDEGSTPPQRPKSQPTTVAKEISEVDFWDLDEESELADSSENSVLPQPRQKSILPRNPTKKATTRQTVTPKLKPVDKPAAPTATEKPEPAPKAKGSRLKVGTPPPKISKRYPSASSDIFGSKDLSSDPLEDEPVQKRPKAPEPEEEELTLLPAVEEIEKAPEAELEPEAIVVTEPEPDEEIVQDEETPEYEAEAVIESKAPEEIVKNLKGKLNLTRVEMIGLGSFIVVLLGVAIFFLTQAIYKLPAEKKLMGSGGFPVTGQLLSITDAETYWRKPIADGPRQERVRRDTLLIPVLKLSLTQGKGAIRVLFRDSNNQQVGDGITRATAGATSVEIAATAGFEKTGMHAAYRTGEEKPWTVEVFEAPGIESLTGQFKKIYEAHIASELR